MNKICIKTAGLLLALVSGGLLCPSGWTEEVTEQQVAAQITGCDEFSIDAPRSGGPVVNAADFGLKEHNHPEDNVKALQKALAYCKEKQAYKLIIPKGVYSLRWFNDQPVEEQMAYVCSASANPAVTRLIVIEGMRDFILDGQGAEFIVLDTDKLSMGAMLYIAHCERVRVENLTLDWDWENRPLAAIGFIKSVRADKGFIDWYVPYLRLPADTKLNRESGTTGKPWDPIINMRPPEVRPWVLADDSPGYGEFSGEKIAREEVLDPHHLRVWMKNKKSLDKARTGQCANLTFHTNFDPNGVEANYNDHLVLRNINLYAALNHRAFTADYNRYLEISKVNIIPRPGTARAKTAHGTFEIHNSRGYFLCEDNVVDAIMDDFMHLSDGFVGGGIQIKDERTLQCDRIQFYSARFTLKAGETVDFLDAVFNPLGVSRTIESVKWLGDAYPAADKQQAALVTFTEPLPAGLQRKTILMNRALGAGHYIVRRNKGTTMTNRAIATTWPNGRIEDNEFSNVGYSGIHIGVSPFGGRWFLGPGSSNLIIRRNVFKNVNRVRRDGADIAATEIAGAGLLLKNLLIENNTFENSVSDQLMDLRHFKGVIIRNNRFINPACSAENEIRTKQCEDVFTHGNLRANPD